MAWCNVLSPTAVLGKVMTSEDGGCGAFSLGWMRVQLSSSGWARRGVLSGVSEAPTKDTAAARYGNTGNPG